MYAATTRLPLTSLQDEWLVARTQHWARTSGAFDRRPAAPAPAPAAAPQRPADDRAARRAEHLLRLASDERSTPNERALAAERAADLLRRFA